MLSKKIFITAFIATLMAMSSPALAGVRCTEATIDDIGYRPSLATSESDGLVLRLTCSNDSSLWGANPMQFLVKNTLGDTGYATLLTAKSLGKKIDVWVEGRTWNSLVTDLVMTDISI
jgi:hypothetical protein